TTIFLFPNSKPFMTERRSWIVYRPAKFTARAQAKLPYVRGASAVFTLTTLSATDFALSMRKLFLPEDKMVIYEITAAVEPNLAEAYEKYMRERHIPD